jgi:uncharacterized OsmC-like protein
MTSKAIYLGQLRVQSTHLKSGEVIISDAPTDNNGKGAAFSPTDMVANALAACMLTIMGIKAMHVGINIDQASAQVSKVMASNPRRISVIDIKLLMPAGIGIEHRPVLEAAALHCPVGKSIDPEIEQIVAFEWL